MLPVLDISPYLDNPSSADSRRFIDQLRETCHGPGFFYLVGHGLNTDLNANVQRVANDFFNLPIAEREAIAIKNSAQFRGYTLLSQERTNGKIDWRDQIDIGPEEPKLPLTAEDPPWLRLRGPNLWPASLPQMPMTVKAG